MTKSHKESTRDKYFSDPKEGDRESQVIESLENKITGLNNRIKEERFYFITIFIVLFDCIVFTNFNNWGAPIAILILEIIFLFIIAKKFSIEEVVALVDRILEWNKKDDPRQ